MQQNIAPVTPNIDQHGPETSNHLRANSYIPAPEIPLPQPMQLDHSPSSNTGYSSLERPLWLPSGTPSLVTGREAEFSNSVVTSSAFGGLDMDPQGTADSWGLNANSQVPGWFVSDDFDLTALNSSIMAPVQDQLPYPGIVPEPTPPITVDHTEYTPGAGGEHKEDVVSRHWLTYLATDGSGMNTPDVPEQTQVDDAYRDSLSRQLQQRVQNEPLPSTDFLVCPYLCAIW